MLGVEAMLEEITDQGAFGVCDGFFDRLHLLRDFEAGFSRLDHVNYGAKMPIGALQPGNESGMGCMHTWLSHESELSSPGGSNKVV